MLLELEIRNFALIDHISLTFEPGFTILSGETGAGKSILIDAVNMCLGARADRDLVKHGQEKAVIQAVFVGVDKPANKSVMTEAGIEIDSSRQLIVSREIHATGRSISRINGVTVTQQLLKSIMQQVMDIHGQHEHQSLLNQDTHIHMLDAYGGSNLQQKKSAFSQCYLRVLTLQQELKKLGFSETERARKLDFLSFQIEEIQSAALTRGEEEALSERNELLRHAQQITAALGTFHEEVYEGSLQPAALDLIGRNVKTLWDVSSYSKALETFAERAEVIQDNLQDLSRDLKNYLEQTEFDPAEITLLQERLDLIHKLKRKYGDSVETILDCCGQLQAEYDDLVNSEERYGRLQEELRQAVSRAGQMAGELSRLRMESADQMEQEMVQVLNQLNMGKVVFSVENQTMNEKGTDALTLPFHENGIDHIAFMISTNPGEPVKPLSKIVSGGEMSRIMLAFKTLFARIDDIPTLIFDEIDSGISGKTAQIVGEKLKYVSRTHQVICITHLPQIAALADTHLLIRKQAVDLSTRVEVTRLSEEERLYELGRLLDGDLSDIALSHAREMRNKAKAVGA